MTRSGFAAIARIARRSLVRHRWQTLLVVVLIAIPVFGMTAAALILENVAPTADERATSYMGQADLRVDLIGDEGTPAQLEALLPAGSEVEPVRFGGDDFAVPGRQVSTELRFVDLDGLGRGMLTLLDGRTPTASDEVAVSPEVARRAAATIGGTLTLAGMGEVRIVGLVEDPAAFQRLVVLGDPVVAAKDPARAAYLISLPPGASADEVALEIANAVPPGKAPDESFPVFEATTRDIAGTASETFTTLVFVLGALALVEAALVAAASFAVGIRRRQRELGLLGAAGGTPRQLAASVLIEGLMAGALATVIGVALGLVAAVAITPFLDDLTGRRVGPTVVDVSALLGAVVIGMGAAVIAASVPAWGAARLPTLAALSGKRPPSTPARRLLSVGILLVGIAIASSVLIPFLPDATSNPFALLLLLVGAVTGVIGFGACSPWLLERFEGPARRLPLAGRIALRDTARARTRNGPIVTAVLASVAAMIALSALMASQRAQAYSFWQPDMGPDVLLIGGSDVSTVGPDVALALGAMASGPLETVTSPGSFSWLEPTGATPEAGDDVMGGIVVGDETMLIALGGEEALTEFRAGSTVVFPFQPITGHRATLRFLGENDREVAAYDVDIAVVLTSAPHWGRVPNVIIPVATARELGLGVEPAPTQFLIRLPRNVTEDDLSQAAAISARVPGADASVDAPVPPPDPMAAFRLLLLAASLLAALTITGVAVALGETEARPDQRTLLALGADRGLRRRITASRAAVLAALAGALAVPAGLLPVWGVLIPRGWPIVIPLPEVLGALVLLPVMAVLGGLLLGRPIPEWAARRDSTA